MADTQLRGVSDLLGLVDTSRLFKVRQSSGYYEYVRYDVYISQGNRIFLTGGKYRSE